MIFLFKEQKMDDYIKLNCGNYSMYIRPEYIIAISPYDKGKNTKNVKTINFDTTHIRSRILLTGVSDSVGSSWLIVESPDEIMQLIDELYKRRENGNQ
jgi:hypothetical protein